MGISKQMQLEEMDRNQKAEERLSESIARDDDVGFKDRPAILKEMDKMLQDEDKDQ
jgi:hypothetical protein